MGSEIQGIEQKNWWRYEWFELYNNTSLPLALDGWKLELYRTSLDWSLELTGTIPAGGYFFVVSSDKISSGFGQNYSNLAGKFVNDGQKVLLKNPSGAIIDELDCANGWFAGNNSEKLTMERINPLLSGNNKDNWLTSKNTNGTPGLKNDGEEVAKNQTETKENATSATPEEKTNEEPLLNREAGQVQTKNIGNKDFSPLTLLTAGILAVFCAIFIFFIKRLQQNKNLL
jgi:hypothetical protein